VKTPLPTELPFLSQVALSLTTSAVFPELVEKLGYAIGFPSWQISFGSPVMVAVTAVMTSASAVLPRAGAMEKSITTASKSPNKRLRFIPTPPHIRLYL
jgi:hypothetical protein